MQRKRPSLLNRSKLYQSNKISILRLVVYIRSIFHNIFSMMEGTDVHGTIESIRKNVVLRGAQIWILMCAAVLASLGLDVGSAAVVIGAMLISPLMSPILGIGLGVGINDRDLLVSSLVNFGIAVIISIVTSTLYFLVTPIGEPNPELISRTTPTLLDVGVAFFGGVAGIAAGSRKEKTNAIPGVAIATALMPPLCTAGFGIATGRPSFFFGAFYLFFINAVFISLSTYVVVRLLRFPYVRFFNKKRQRNVQRWIAAFAVIVIIPSGIIFYEVIADLRTQNKVKKFMEEHLQTDTFEALRYEISEQDSTAWLKVYLVGEPLDDDRIQQLAASLEDYNLDDYTLKVIQMNLPEEERERLAQQATEDVLNTIEISQRVRDVKQEQIDSLEEVLLVMRSDTIPLWQITGEMRGLFPQLERVTFARRMVSADTLADTIPTFFLDFASRTRRSERRTIIEKLQTYLNYRTSFDTLRLLQLPG